MLRDITVKNSPFVCSVVSALLGAAHTTGRDFGWDVLGSMFEPAKRTTLIIGPDESHGGQPTWLPIDERLWRNLEILLSASETELEDVNGCERAQDQTNDSPSQLAAQSDRCRQD